MNENLDPESLKKILNEDELAVLSRIFFDGWSLRGLARSWCCSHTKIRCVRDSGLKKLKAHSVELVKPKKFFPRKRKAKLMDPREMDRRFTVDQAYHK